MEQVFFEGLRIPVTKIQTGTCVVTQIRPRTDNTWSIQLGYGARKIANFTKPLQGHLKGATKDKKAPYFLAEFSLKEKPELNVGDRIKAAAIFQAGDIVSVSGITKSKGFAGVVKRWHFKGGPKTHGQSDRQRAPGSIGSTTTPGRVLKGKHMAGRLGGQKVTVKNLHVVVVDPETGEITLSGPVPGHSGASLIVRKIASGSLKELEHEKVAQIVEGEPEPVKTEETTVGQGGEPNA